MRNSEKRRALSVGEQNSCCLTCHALLSKFSRLSPQVLSRAHVNTAVRIPRTLLPREIFSPELHPCQVWPLAAELLVALAPMVVVMNAIVLSYCFLI